MQPTRYRLLMTPRSPFARRVRLALERLEVPFDREEVAIFDPSPAFLGANPLGLVPVLWVPQAQLWLADSATQLEHLHEAEGGRIWPAEGPDRCAVRQASTWAVGIMTATVAFFLEISRKCPGEEVLQEHRETVERTLDLAVALENPWEKPGVPAPVLTQAGWDLAVALEYLDLRLPSLNWRGRTPALARVLDEARRSPAFRDSAPPPAA